MFTCRSPNRVRKHDHARICPCISRPRSALHAATSRCITAPGHGSRVPLISRTPARQYGVLASIASSAASASASAIGRYSIAMPSRVQISSTTPRLMPPRMRSRGGETTTPSRTMRKLAAAVSVSWPDVSSRSACAGLNLPHVLIGEPPVQAAALLDAWIDALRGNLAHRRHHQRGAVFDQATVACQRQRKRVHAKRRRPIAGAAGLAQVVPHRPGRGE